MLSIALLIEASRRWPSEARGIRLSLDEATHQAGYCLDAPEQVQDGIEWFDDPEFDVHGPVPRFVDLRAGV